MLAGSGVGGARQRQRGARFRLLLEFLWCFCEKNVTMKLMRIIVVNSGSCIQCFFESKRHFCAVWRGWRQQAPAGARLPVVFVHEKCAFSCGSEFSQVSDRRRCGELGLEIARKSAQQFLAFHLQDVPIRQRPDK
jgi:hypothetical protein